MAIKNKVEKDSRKGFIFKLTIFVVYLIILLFFLFLLINIGVNPFIVSLLFIFILLASIAPFLKRNKKSLYSRMFPDRKKTSSLSEQRTVQSKIFKPINLNFNYRKPIINKCENCGNIVPNFVKKCPFCNHSINI